MRSRGAAWAVAATGGELGVAGPGARALATTRSVASGGEAAWASAVRGTAAGGELRGGGGWEHELWRQPEGRRRCRDPELGVAGPGVSDQIRGGSGGIRQRQLMAEGQQLGRWLLGAMAARSERRRARTKGFERRWARAKQRKAAARGSSGYSANPGRRRLGLEQGSHGGGIDVEESLWGSGAAGRPTALGKKKENRGRVNRGVSGGSK